MLERMPQLRPAGRRWLSALLAAAAVLAGAGAYAAVRLSAPSPPAPVRRSVSASLALAGTPPRLPWPAGSEGYLTVRGVGAFAGPNPDRPVPVGSVAKVMTAFLVLRAHPLAAGASGPAIPVTAADVADYQNRRHRGQSLVPLVPGESLTERQALQALLLPSANDVATMLARWQAGSVPAFVAAMNVEAARLHLTGTRYTDPSGLDPGTVSTPRDQVSLAERAMALPAFAAIVAQPRATLPVAGTVRNYNFLLGRLGVLGVKTGSTDQAGGNLVFAAVRRLDGRPVTFVGAVLGVGVGSPPGAALVTAEQQSATLLAAAEAAVRPVTVLAAGRAVGTLRPAWAGPDPLRVAAPLVVLGWPGLTVTVRFRARPLRSARAGQRDGELLAELPGAAAPARAPVAVADRLRPPSVGWLLTHP